MRAFAIIALGLVVACGNSSPPQATTSSSGPPASLVATSAAADDVQVATVNGRPVWGSCVSAQAARGVTRDVALRECVDFELMAQAAEQRGLAVIPEVVEATHTALVNQLVAYDYDAKFEKPSDFGPLFDQLVARNKGRESHDEYRASAYVRINVKKGASAVDDEAAHAVMTEIAAALAPERGLTPTHLKSIAEQVAAGRAKIEYQVVPLFLRRGLEPAYADALFTLPEIGRTTSPVRTSYGWDVVLWNDVVPAAHPSPAELAEKMLPDVKRSYFAQWANQIAQRLHVTVTYFEKNLPLLENM